MYMVHPRGAPALHISARCAAAPPFLSWPRVTFPWAAARPFSHRPFPPRRQVVTWSHRQLHHPFRPGDHVATTSAAQRPREFQPRDHSCRGHLLRLPDSDFRHPFCRALRAAPPTNQGRGRILKCRCGLAAAFPLTPVVTQGP
jgi:hypothetical protein